MRLMQVESGSIVLGGIAARLIDRAQGEMMPDIAVAEMPVDEEERPLPPPSPPARNTLVDGPILRTLLWLAWPNVIALSAGTCVVIAETSYIGRLGVESLAAMALVFPFVILTMTMSGGAMGGGVSSAIARALGQASGLEVSLASARSQRIHKLAGEGLGQLGEISTMLLIAAIGPASWLAMRYLPTPHGINLLPEALKGLLGPLIVFGALPRVVAGPALLALEGAAFFLFRQRIARASLGAAMLMDLIPLSIFAMHVAAANHY